MIVNEKVKYWLDIAEYDLVTAEAMLKTKRYLYVAFMCHQVIEKTLKAYYVFLKNKIPPYIHNLSTLSKKSGLYEKLSEEQKDFIDFVDPLNIEARYPSYKNMLSKTMTKQKSKEILENTKELKIWIEKQLLS